jgi:phosphate:Na+ symporter
VRILESPVLALQQSRVEVLKMAESCRAMMGWLREILESESPDPALVRKAQAEEKRLDTMQDELVEFLSRLLASNLPESLVGEVRQQLRMVDEYESISDYIGRIVKYQTNLVEAAQKYDPLERETLLRLHDMVAAHLDSTESTCRSADGEDRSATAERGKSIAQEVRQLRRDMIDRMGEGTVTPTASITYNRQLNAYRRIRDHAVNILEAIAGEK